MAVPKMTEAQWADAYAVWSQDERGGYAWLVRELELPVSAPAVRKRAIKTGWAKGEAAVPKPQAKRKKPVATKAKSQKPETTQAETQKPEPEKPEKRNQKPEPTAKTSTTVQGDEEAGGQAGSPAESGHTRVKARDLAINDFEYGGLADLMGRMPGETTHYRPEYALIALRFMMLGATVEDLADLIGVSRSRIYVWEKAYPDLASALKGGREMADSNVAARLYQRAMGYTHEAEEIKVVDGGIERVNVLKHYPPDAQSAMFWLKNRQPDKWKDKVEVVEQPTIALVDKEKMDELYDKALQQAAETQERMAGRAERLGLTLEGDYTPGGEDD